MNTILARALDRPLTATLHGHALIAAARTLARRLHAPQRLACDDPLALITALLACAIAGQPADLLPRDDGDARVLVRLAGRCVVVSSLLTSLACVAAASWVSSRYGSAELAAWLCGSGVTVFALAQAANLQYWLTRKGRFGDIARSSVVRSLAVAGLQLVCGWAAGGGLNALIGATVVGQLIALAYVWGRGRDARAPGGPDGGPGRPRSG